jgi:hypothetical protein
MLEPWVGHGVPLDWPRRSLLQPSRVSHPPPLALLLSARCQWVPLSSKQPAADAVAAERTVVSGQSAATADGSSAVTATTVGTASADAGAPC